MTKPHVVRLMIGGFLLLLAVGSHFAACTWSVKDRLSDPPFLTVRDNVIADERYAAKEDFAYKQLTQINEQIEELVGNDDSAVARKLQDRSVAAKHHALVDENRHWLAQIDESSRRARGKFGVYPRGSRDGGLVLGLVTPAIFLVGGLFMVAWGLSHKGQASQLSGG